MTLQRILTLALEAAAAVCALLAVSPSWGQSSDSPTLGRELFEDTPNASGLNNLTSACVNCHGSVQNRRIKIGGSAYADISFDSAITSLGSALQSVSQMRQFQALSSQQVRDLAAYIADTPKTSAARLDFSATAVNTVTLPQAVDLRSSIATTASLRVESVSIGGASAARFTASSDTCTAQTLPAGGTCRVSLTFSSPDTAGHVAPLTFTLREVGASSNFTRTVTLNGVAAASTTPPVATGGDESGGGALGWPWLAALAAAAVAARRATG